MYRACISVPYVYTVYNRCLCTTHCGRALYTFNGKYDTRYDILYDNCTHTAEHATHVQDRSWYQGQHEVTDSTIESKG